MFLEIISIVCLIYSLYSSGKLLINIIGGYVELRKIDGLRYPGIKCENMSFSVMSYLISIFLDVVLIYCFVKLETTAEQLESMWSMWMFRGLILVQIISLLAHVIVLFYDKYAYLTYRGMVHITGVMEFEKCRFAWEQSEEELSQYILVYKEKSNHAFRFHVTEEIEKAHEMV